MILNLREGSPEKAESDAINSAFMGGEGVYRNASFGRVITAMVTPFDSDGRLDLDSAEELAVYLEQNGSEGLVVAGTTGESATLTNEEQIALIERVGSCDNIPILAGTGANSTAEAVEMTEEVRARGIADGILVVSPYYNRPPQRGIIDYFEQVSDTARALPMVAYDIPARTGRAVDTETIIYLAKNLDNLTGVKLAAGSLDQTSRLKQAVPELELYSGDDSLNLQHVQRGAVGAISVISHWAGNKMVEMFDSFESGNVKNARCIDKQLEPSYKFSSSNEAPNPIPTKAMMRHLGLNVGYCRSPMTVGLSTQDMLHDQAQNILSSLKD